MQIDNIRIQNFKCFEDASFDLNARFTVFIGENATGKTTVLDALAIAMGSFLLGIEEVASKTIEPAQVRVAMIDGQPRPQLPVNITATGQIDEQLVRWTRGVEKRNTTTKAAKGIKDIASRKLEQSRKGNGSPVLFPVLAYHGTGRLWAEHEKINFQKQEEGVMQAYKNCLSAKSSSKQFLDWYKTQEDTVQKFQQPLDIAHLQAFKGAILRLIPDARWQDMAFDHKANDLMGVYTDASQNRHKLAYSQLSDGFRNIIGFAADIAYRCIQLNPHLGERAVEDTPGIVLIDELDLHLHPNWQRRIVSDLKRCFPRVQFIAATHSPFIVQSLAQEELINLDAHYADLAPKDLALNQVVTELMGVTDIRSDNFKERYQKAKKVFDAVEQEKLSLDDYQQVSDAIGSLLQEESNDPVYRAYLDKKSE